MTRPERSYVYKGSHRAIVVRIIVPEIEGHQAVVSVMTEKYVNGVPDRYLDERTVVDLPSAPKAEDVWEAVRRFAQDHLDRLPPPEAGSGTPSGGGEGGVASKVKGDTRIVRLIPVKP